MNTVKRLNAIIDYVEEHLCETLDIDVISKIACLSAYDAQRMFCFVAEISLSEYIRNRRLTLAGQELKDSDAKVIDIALKYGYDSSVSFARAFVGFHGITPSMAKSSDSSLHVFPRLVFQINVSEVIEMLKCEKITVNGKEYNAEYYGEKDISWHKDYSHRRFWRLENAYDDFKDCKKTNEVLPYHNYPPMDIKLGDVFVIDYYFKDSNKVERKYYVSDGTVYQDEQSTREIILNNA